MPSRGFAFVPVVVAIGIVLAGAASYFLSREYLKEVPSSSDIGESPPPSLSPPPLVQKSPAHITPLPHPMPPASSPLPQVPAPVSPPPPPSSLPSSAKQRLAERLRQIGVQCIAPSINDYTTGLSFAVSPARPSTLYVNVRYKGVFKSADGGATWQKADKGIFAYPDRNNPSALCLQGTAKMAADPVNPDRVLLAWLDINTGYITDPYGETAGLWETTDGGASWHIFMEDWMNVGAAGALAIGPNDARVAYYGIDNTPASYKEADPNRLFNTKGVIYKTTDGGKHWEELPTGLHFGLHGTAIFINPKNSKELFLLTNTHEHVYTEQGALEIPGKIHFGPMKSSDGGRTWVTLGHLLPEGYKMIVEGDVSPKNFDHSYMIPFRFSEAGALETEQKSFYSRDGGASFHPSNYYMQVARFDPHDPAGNRLVGATAYGPPAVLESTDSGATWQEFSKLPPEASRDRISITNFVWDPQNPSRLYMTGGAGYVWRSDDNGKTWRTMLNLENLPQ